MTNFSDQVSLLGLSFRTKECCFRYLLRLPIPMRGEEVEKGNRERRQGEECRDVERREENEKRREEKKERREVVWAERRGGEGRESESETAHDG
jgi:hypothetical protein